MYYKPDWEQAKERLLAYWNHAVIDRACIAVHAPKRESDMPPFPNLHNGPWLGEMPPEDDKAGIEKWWTDPGWNKRRAITWFENNWFGGEALPVTYVNWGAMALCGIYGSDVQFNNTSVWYSEVIKDWATWEWVDDPRETRTWKQLVAIVDALVDGAEGRYFVGKPELGNGADCLSLMRGMDKLALDLIMDPDAVVKGVDVISDAWVSLMEEMYQRLTAINDDGDVLAWMGLWAPGRTDQVACDFSTVISPDMLRQFFVPEIRKMGQWCDNGVYHLDGPDCMREHLEVILEQEEIQVIQFTPGAGSPPTSTPEYLPRFKRIIDAGKRVYLLVEPEEVQPVLESLGPEGVYMRVFMDSQDEGERMIEDVARWSAKGGVVTNPGTPRQLGT